MTADAAFLSALVAALPAGDVLTGDAIPERNAHDWSDRYAPVPPVAVVRAADAGGVAAAMKLCAAHGVPVTAQGGLTGLCGGGTPVAGGVAISLERMAQIEEIDPDAMTMTLGAGVPLEAAQKAAAEAGLMVPLDLGARGSCAIGGNISTNAGGNRVIRYGMTREMVLGLEVVLPTGEVVTSLNKMLKNNAGYDLKQLFIGAEGTLGIVTRAVIRLAPRPASTMAAMCGLSSYDDLLKLLRAARSGLGPMLSAFEVMWPDYWSVISGTPGLKMPLPDGFAIYALVEAQGTDDAADPARFQAWLEAQAEAGLVEDAAVAQSLADVARFWEVRDAVSEFSITFGPHCAFDIGLPQARMDEFARACRAAMDAEWPGTGEAIFYGHIGDGNMHIGGRVRGAAQQPKERICEIVYGLVRDFGGTVSAEHGIGTLKKPYLSHARSDAELALMARLRAALDPAGIMNPGKVF
ncbi:FAD-binding oxidoreductase [Rhodovulum sp. DZ06]|uniref:FAD-binding oxidoreductase n=1 Tax=Rhodovulum sp. DZ06 TaxID=3425126 RepID=UPI003D34F020